jgi:hypothetical protein
MKPIHYGLSFISGCNPENSVRFWVESRLRVIDEKTGRTEDYYQCGSCKSEDTFAPSHLFYSDNYDFTPVFGPQYGIVYRRKAYLNPNYKTCPEAADMWGGQLYKLKEPEYCMLLESNEDIRKATHDAVPLVAQTELYNTEFGLRTIMEYPVKTMNIHDRKNMYQVDTGPVLLMDLSANCERTVDAISLAYVAFNAPDFADFVIEQPTHISDGDQMASQVYHYSGIVSLPAINRLFAVK